VAPPVIGKLYWNNCTSILENQREKGSTVMCMSRLCHSLIKVTWIDARSNVRVALQLLVCKALQVSVGLQHVPHRDGCATTGLKCIL
jgi:hypothetical protein